MSTSIYEVLEDLRGRATSEADKGSKLERLIAQFLRTDPSNGSRCGATSATISWAGRVT
jgi:predicted helicase